MSTESGLPLDATFGYRSVENRIVNSPMAIGTTAALLEVIGNKAAAIYRGAAK